jgi:superoxide dismutase, Fe-Mn family
MNTRRSFLSQSALLTSAAFVAPATAVMATSMQTQQSQSKAPFQPHVLPPLPYAPEALEPYIDATTMKLHHGKHHQAYVNGLNKAEQELATARASNDYALIQHWSKQAAFHGGGHFLHSMFWNVMAPPQQGGGLDPSPRMSALLTRSFGSVETAKAHLSAAANAVEGSGWGLMHFRTSDSTLHVLQAENQHKLSPWGAIPVLGIDVWEHAYYLTYQNKRADYVSAFWSVVHWAAVEKNIELAGGWR